MMKYFYLIICKCTNYEQKIDEFTFLSIKIWRFCFKLKKISGYIKMLNLTISELIWIEKRRNMDGYKNMSKQQLENLVTET